MEADQALRNFLTGVRRQRPPTDRAILSAAHRAYGTWNDVAAAMGISARTLRRVRAGLVSPRSRQRLRHLSVDPNVRAATVTPGAARRLARMRTHDTRVVVAGTQGPIGYGRMDYTRERTIDFSIAPDFMVPIADAFFSGDDQTAVELFNDALIAEYGQNQIVGQGWEVADDAQINMDV